MILDCDGHLVGDVVEVVSVAWNGVRSVGKGNHLDQGANMNKMSLFLIYSHDCLLELSPRTF
jgi:hypothetical protein